jgi:hypothetical protein
MPKYTMNATAESLSSCFPSWTSVCGEKNSRLNPESGLSLLNFGLRTCGENRTPNSMTFTAMTSAVAAANAVPTSNA